MRVSRTKPVRPQQPSPPESRDRGSSQPPPTSSIARLHLSMRDKAWRMAREGIEIFRAKGLDRDRGPVLWTVHEYAMHEGFIACDGEKTAEGSRREEIG